MLPKMSEKKTETPVMIVSTQNEVSQPPEPRSYRKYVIFAVTGIVLAAIILIAILVGVYFSTEAQKEILKFSYNRDENAKEDVISDPNTNIVQYHVNSPNYEVWVVNDFNRDIQMMKIQTASETNCYVTPLNRTMATEPSKVIPRSNSQNMDIQVKKPQTTSGTNSFVTPLIRTMATEPSKVNPTSNPLKENARFTVNYIAASTPIPDSTFLCKAARDTCKGISTYWIYPVCEASKNPSDSSGRRKRAADSRFCWGICW